MFVETQQSISDSPLSPPIGFRKHSVAGSNWSLPITDTDHVNALKPLIVSSVDWALRMIFPKKYFGLCHVYAIVGASVTSTVLGREYRPVAGMAVIDFGAGCLLKLTENDAFSREVGGAYHCWIESAPTDTRDQSNKELIDLTFQHNATYAKKHKMIWRKKSSAYLWANYHDAVIDAPLEKLPTAFPEGKVWLRETPEGQRWMDRQVAEHMDEYVKLTAFALKRLISQLNLRAA